MARYSDEVIDRVRDATDIVSVVSRYVSLKKTGKYYMGLCPFHSEKSGSFAVDQERQMFYCFGCRESGNAFGFLMKYENYTFPEAVEALAKEAGIELPQTEMTAAEKQRADERTRLKELQKEACYYFYAVLRSERGKVGMDYFRKRQLTEDTIKKFALGYAPASSSGLYQYLKSKGFSDDELGKSALFVFDEKRGVRDRFWNRVMFPIMDANMNVIGFGGRILGEKTEKIPKYLNSSETMIFEKKRNLYGFNYARHSKRDSFLLCEGYMDVISLHQAGFDHAVASLGTALTEQQAMLMFRYKKKIYLTYDSDDAGVKAALRAIPILKKVGFSVRIVSMEPYKDPDEFIRHLGAEEYEKRIKEAELSFFFEIEQEKKKYELSDPEQKTKFYTQLAIMLLGFSQELERENYLKAVVERYQISESGLRQLMHENARKVKTTEEIILEKEMKKQEKKQLSHDDAIRQAHALILKWLSEDVSLFEKTKGILSAEDFIDEPYHTFAKYLYEQYETTGSIQPSMLTNRFEELKEQEDIVEIFFTKATVRTDRELDKEELEQAFNENLKRLKKYQIDKLSENLSGKQELLDLIQKKKALETMYIKL